MSFNAVEFLESLYRPETARTIRPDELLPDWHFRWDERAAIMEYEGGLPRERAEAEALTEILHLMAAETSSIERDTGDGEQPQGP